VHDRHALQHGVSIVGNDRLSFSASNHLVHSSRTQRRSDGISNSCIFVSILISWHTYTVADRTSGGDNVGRAHSHGLLLVLRAC
jgi:hypothetical protein